MRGFEAAAVREVPNLLHDWLDEPTSIHRAAEPAGGVDLVVRAKEQVFAVLVKSSADIAVIEQAVEQLAAYVEARPGVVRLLVVPYMGPKARAYARERGLSWLDLSGNADIRGQGLRVLVDGQPNRFAAPGRPSTVFSPKASRLSRAMLARPNRWWLQRELAEETRLSAGFVSKVVRRMLEDLLLERREDGLLRPRTPSVLLAAWAQEYSFFDHEVRKCHAVGRTGQAVLQTVAGRMERTGCQWAATGLSAAWMWTQHADFRLVTVFISDPGFDPEVAGLRSVERGENVWVVVPRDEGVFDGVEQLGPVPCVHPVQVWLDLQDHPERSNEAASRLSTELLGWRA